LTPIPDSNNRGGGGIKRKVEKISKYFSFIQDYLIEGGKDHKKKANILPLTSTLFKEQVDSYESYQFMPGKGGEKLWRTKQLKKRILDITCYTRLLKRKLEHLI